MWCRGCSQGLSSFKKTPTPGIGGRSEHQTTFNKNQWNSKQIKQIQKLLKTLIRCWLFGITQNRCPLRLRTCCHKPFYFYPPCTSLLVWAEASYLCFLWAWSFCLTHIYFISNDCIWLYLNLKLKLKMKFFHFIY